MEPNPSVACPPPTRTIPDLLFFDMGIDLPDGHDALSPNRSRLGHIAAGTTRSPAEAGGPMREP